MKVGDLRHRADLVHLGIACPGLPALADQHHAEARPSRMQRRTMSYIAGLENAQRQRSVGKQHELSGNSGIRVTSAPEARGLARAERGEELLVQAAEAAVAHDEHLIAGLHLGSDARDQALDTALEARTRSQGREGGGQIPVEPRDSEEPRTIGGGECRRELVPVDAKLHGVRARLEHRDDSCIRQARAQTRERGLDRRRMMREIVIHRHTTHGTANLHAPLHAAELREGERRALGRNADVLGRGDRREGIHDIVLAEELPAHFRHRAAVAQHGELAARLPRRERRAPLIVRAQPEGLARRPAARGDHRLELGVGAIAHNASGSGHGAQQLRELPADRRDVRINVRVVVFEVVQDQRSRPVVHELGALVEERRVVLVGLDHEMRGAPMRLRRAAAPTAEARRRVEIARHAADQKSRLEARMLEYPGEHARSRGLAMRPRDREHVAVLEHVLRQPLRSRGVRHAAIEQRFDHRTAATQRIAHHHDVGIEIELLGSVPLDELDAQRRELIAHGRIDVQVRPGDAESRGLGDRRQAAHEGPRNSQDVYMHAQDFGSSCCSRAIDSNK